MIQKQLPFYSSGFFFFTILLACSFFLSIISASNTGTTKTLRGSPSPTGIAAISLTSQSQERKEEDEQQVKNVLNAVEQVKCKTEQGNDVDWFIVYKLPKNRTSSNALVRAGLAYAYILPPQQQATSRTTTADTVDISVNETASGKKGSYSGSGGHDGDLNNYFASSGKDTPPPLSANTIEKVTKSAAADAGTSSATWTLSDKGIDSSGSMVGQSLGKLYVKDNQDIAFLTYNDQPPVGPTIDSGGHSKGIIIASIASGGIWIQHSVPHFPLIDPNNYYYQYPATGKTNGQVFHCISFSSTKHVDDLAKIFEITKPHVANFSFPTDSFKKALPQLMSIANHHRGSHLENQDGKNQFSANNLSINNRSVEESAEKYSEGATEEPSSEPQSQQLPCSNEIDERACLLNRKLLANKTAKIIKNEETPRRVTTKFSKQNWDLIKLESAGGKTFQAFVKGPSFNEEIYSSWIAPTYKTKLEVQSWLNGPNPLASNCSLAQYSVFNILGKSIAGHAFSTHNDHSKWAMSLSAAGDAQAQPLVCISDLNRMEHQLKRGGVAVCFTDQTIWSTFSSSIIDVQPCPRLLADGIVTATPINNNMTLSSSLQKSGSILSTLNPSSKDENQTEDQSTLKSSVNREQIRRQPPRMFQRKVKSRTYSLTAI